MKSVIFNITTHNHQPVGNFEHVFEDSYQKSYDPFFEVAARYPTVKFATHFSGPLLQWLLKKYPDYHARLRVLVERGQLDLLSGGFYEPMLSVIPRRDAITQIEKLTTRIQSEFGYHAEGMWLAERVWDQPLAGVLHDANIKFVMLDDTHFLSAGLSETDLNGYYLTEDQGKTLAIFPTSKLLRYTIPFKQVDETIQILREASSESGNSIVFFADDGEKFGVWPQTYHSVYEEGWLEEFFRKLDENRSWIETLHGTEILKRVKPKGRIYLPNGSYAEMMQWALPTAKANQAYEDLTHMLEDDEKWKPYLSFVRGGFWPNFFVKYPESNHLHKRMVEVSRKVELAKRRKTVDRTVVSEAEDHILAAQCNDAYWHGVFGGIYLPNLRHGLYTELLTAERLIDGLERTRVRIDESDFDRDGSTELCVSTGVLSAVFAPEHGGRIAELDYMPGAFNASNIMNRQREAYHSKIREGKTSMDSEQASSIHDLVLAKEDGLEQHLVEDWYSHGSFLDHFFMPDLSLEQFASMHFDEAGDFLKGSFAHTATKLQKGIFVEMERNGVVWVGSVGHPVRMKKSIELLTEKGTGKVTYEIVNDSPDTLLFKFGSEWVCNFLAGNAPDRFFEADGVPLDPPQLSASSVVTGKTRLRIVDNWMKLAFEIDCKLPTEFWRTPIETVSLSEGGFERVYQGSIVMPVWQVQLAPAEVWKTSFEVSFVEM
jgi:alpha-amylase